MKMTGRALVLPGEISNEELLATRYIIEGFDLDFYADHVLETIVPGLRTKVKPGDILIGGANFCSGNLHAHGFLALHHLKLGVICESMEKAMLRLAVATGLPMLPQSPAALSIAADGDELVVDFVAGEVQNRSKGTKHQFAPLVGTWRDMMLAGGGVPYAASRMRA